jgi:hypothetical protein
MASSENGRGQLFQHDSYLCDLLYEINYPLGFVNIFRVLQIRFFVENYDPTTLIASPDLMLIAADGTKYHLAAPLTMQEEGALQCTINLIA